MAYQHLYPEARNNPQKAKWLAYYVYFTQTRKQDNSAAIHQCVAYFLSPDQLADKAYVRKIQIDMLYCKIMYGITLEDYFVFQFEHKNEAERASYLGEPDMMEMCDEMAFEEGRLFRNKYLAYLTFKPYYKRDVLLVKNEKDLPELRDFLQRHPICMVKALDQSQGRALQRVDLTDGKHSIDEAMHHILQRGECVLEELIVQAEGMGKFHPSSVNTIRFATYLNKGEQKNVFALLRIGMHGGVIDNASAGGIFAEVDVNTGVVKTPGLRRKGEQYVQHPDTGVTIQGAQIPQWDELLALTEKLTRVVPQQKYVGWDLALTNEGWVMVEGNHKAAATGIQVCRNRGMRKDFLELFGRA